MPMQFVLAGLRRSMLWLAVSAKPSLSNRPPRHHQEQRRETEHDEAHDPYFLQELGYAVWTIAKDDTITADDVTIAIPQYQSKLDSSFFRVRLDRATEMQRIYLRAMADLGPEPQKAADVAARMNRTSPQVGSTRAELINVGLLYTPEHGYAAFTVPHFDQFMLRAMPTFVAPPVRNRGN